MLAFVQWTVRIVRQPSGTEESENQAEEERLLLRVEMQSSSPQIYTGTCSYSMIPS